jgi:hypothetical protein
MIHVIDWQRIRFRRRTFADQTFGLTSKDISSVPGVYWDILWPKIKFFIQLYLRVQTIDSLRRDGCKNPTKVFTWWQSSKRKCTRAQVKFSGHNLHKNRGARRARSRGDYVAISPQPTGPKPSDTLLPLPLVFLPPPSSSFTAPPRAVHRRGHGSVSPELCACGSSTRIYYAHGVMVTSSFQSGTPSPTTVTVEAAAG